jgi:hypothetical protein
MTVENRQFIEPEDVIALQFECCKCGAKISFPLTDELQFKPQPLIACPACKQDWKITPESQEHDALRQFVDGLFRIGPALKSRTLKLAMEIPSRED